MVPPGRPDAPANAKTIINTTAHRGTTNSALLYPLFQENLKAIRNVLRKQLKNSTKDLESKISDMDAKFTAFGVNLTESFQKQEIHVQNSIVRVFDNFIFRVKVSGQCLVVCHSATDKL